MSLLRWLLLVLSISCVLAVAYTGSTTPMSATKSASLLLGGGGKTVVAPDIEEGVLVPGNSPLVAILPCLCP